MSWNMVNRKAATMHDVAELAGVSAKPCRVSSTASNT